MLAAGTWDDLLAELTFALELEATPSLSEGAKAMWSKAAGGANYCLVQRTQCLRAAALAPGDAR